MSLGRAKTWAVATLEKSIMPKGIETIIPTIMPKNTEPSLSVPLPKLARAKTTAKVIRATHQACGVPHSGVPMPPAMYLTAVGYSETPMEKMTVPVTTGGNSHLILL